MQRRTHSSISSRILAALATLATLALSACSGGGGGSSTAVGALSVPDRIEITQVEGTSGVEVPDGTWNEPGTDYSLAEKRTWVEDTNALEQVNDILGVVADSGYADFVNAGPYRALTRQVGKESQSQSGSSATSTATESLMEVVLDVTREDASSPMYIKVWVKEPDGPGGHAMRIRGYFKVDQGVSEEYPYGILEAHFKGNVLGGGGVESETPVFTMAMQIGADGGDVTVEFVEENAEPGGYESTRRARILAAADMATGNAYAYEYEDNGHDDPSETTALFAFDEDYFKVQETVDALEADPVVYDKHSFQRKIFRYRLFQNADGAAVERNSGYPLVLSGGGNAYVGYYGLWTSPGVEVANGDAAQRPGSNTEYTVLRVKGKLTRHTKSTILLGDLTQVELSFWDAGTDYIVVWNGEEFEKIGERVASSNSVTYYEEGDTESVTFEGWQGVWCQQLSACLRLGMIEDPNDETEVPYHAETTVQPADLAEALPLYYGGFALPVPFTQEDIANAGVLEGEFWSAYDWMDPPEPREFLFDPETMTLTDGGDPVVITDDVDFEGTQWSNGYWIRPMTTTVMSLNEAQEADTYYTWTTGTNAWNQFATLRTAGGELLSFDPPLGFAYTHRQGDDVNYPDPEVDPHAGKQFRIDYDGTNLQMPWCFSESTGEWEPVLNLSDGVVLSNAGGYYRVKAVEEALVMAEAADPSLADSLEIVEVAPPTLTYDSSFTDNVGAVPADAELRVVKGEVLD